MDKWTGKSTSLILCSPFKILELYYVKDTANSSLDSNVNEDGDWKQGFF